MTDKQTLQLHIEEDRLAFAKLDKSVAALDTKMDKAAIEFAKLSTEVRIRSKIRSTVFGLLAGIASSVIVALVVALLK